MCRIILNVIFFLFYATGVLAQEKALELLPGSWKSKSDSSVKEIWEKTGVEYSGKSVRTNSEGEEEVWEKLRLFYQGDTLIYEADLMEGKAPVRFYLTKKDKNELLFSNPQHDFPKFIHYYWSDTNELKVEVYSKKGGKTLKFDFIRTL